MVFVLVSALLSSLTRRQTSRWVIVGRGLAAVYGTAFYENGQVGLLRAARERRFGAPTQNSILWRSRPRTEDVGRWRRSPPYSAWVVEAGST